MQSSTGTQQGHSWPHMVQFEQLKIKPISERCQAETGPSTSLPSPSPAVSHQVFAFFYHKTLALKICFALGPVSKQAAQVHLPGFCQAQGCETAELWVKQIELSQKSLRSGAAQNDFQIILFLFPWLCTFLPPFTCPSHPAWRCLVWRHFTLEGTQKCGYN